MSPKIVNGSFAALFDNNDVIVDFSKKLQDLGKDPGLLNIFFFSFFPGFKFSLRPNSFNAFRVVVGWFRNWILTNNTIADPKNSQAVSTWGPRIPPAVGTNFNCLSKRHFIRRLGRLNGLGLGFIIIVPPKRQQLTCGFDLLWWS